METVDVPFTHRVDEMSDNNGTEVNVSVFNVSAYHQACLFVGIERNNNPDIPLMMLACCT